MSGIPKQTSGVKTTSKETGQIYSKHLLALRDYWTPLKLWNLLHCELEKRRRTISTQAMPYVAVIDVTNACNLRCPGCPSGAGVYGRPKTMLDLGRLARFLDETGRYLLLASLYNWGETLLHPQAPEIVKMVHERRIFTSISTNLNIRNLDRLNAICDAGLDYLIISADGATPESYRKYRVGGDFELVLSNIKHVAEYRRSKMRSRPILEWQVLTFSHLEAELEQVESLAERLGVDRVNTKGPTAPRASSRHPKRCKVASTGVQKPVVCCGTTSFCRRTAGLRRAATYIIRKMILAISIKVLYPRLATTRGTERRASCSIPRLPASWTPNWTIHAYVVRSCMRSRI